MTGSGLEERLWVAQGPDGSTWRLRRDGSNQTNGLDREQFSYSTEGVVTVSTGFTTSFLLRPGSDYKFRYLWRGGRFDGDGMLMMPGGAEHDTQAGTPFAEDAFAYTTYVPGAFFDAAHNQWTAVQEQYEDSGTQAQWSYPEPFYDPKTDVAYSSAFPKWWLDAGDKVLPYVQLTFAIGSLIPGPVGWAALGGSMALGGLETWSQGGSAADVASDVAIQGAFLYGAWKCGTVTYLI